MDTIKFLDSVRKVFTKKIENGVITDVSEEEVMKHFNAPKHSILKKNRVSGTFVCWECGCVRPLHMKQSDGTCGC